MRLSRPLTQEQLEHLSQGNVHVSTVVATVRPDQHLHRGEAPCYKEALKAIRQVNGDAVAGSATAAAPHETLPEEHGGVVERGDVRRFSIALAQQIAGEDEGVTPRCESLGLSPSGYSKKIIHSSVRPPTSRGYP